MGVYDKLPSLIIEDSAKAEHRLLDGERIRGEGPANRRKIRAEAFG